MVLSVANELGACSLAGEVMLVLAAVSGVFTACVYQAYVHVECAWT